MALRHSPVAGLPDLYRVRDPAARKSINWLRRRLAQLSLDFGTYTANPDMFADHIWEYSAGHGVNVDGVHFRDTQIGVGTERPNADIEVAITDAEIRSTDPANAHYTRTVRSDISTARYAQVRTYTAPSKGLLLDGVNQYAQTGFKAHTDLGDWHAFTVMTWIYVHDWTGVYTLFGATEPGVAGGYPNQITMRVNQFGPPDLGAITFQMSGHVNPDESGPWIVSKGVIELNTWHHIAITFDPSVGRGWAHLYIDGDWVFSDESGAGSINHTFPDIQFYVGAHNNDGADVSFFHGVIDEFRIYNYDMVQEDIANHVNSRSYETPRASGFGSIRLGYHFDNDTIDWAGSFDATLFHDPGYDTGIIPAPEDSSTEEITVWRAEDSAAEDESGHITFGDHNSRTAIDGRSIHFRIAGVEVSSISAGGFVFSSHVYIRNNNELRFYDNGNYVGFEAPALAADQIWVLPDADGPTDEVMGTDGSGNLIWRTHSEIAGYVYAEHIDHTTVTFTAGAGMTGGGTIAANRTFNVIGANGITANADDIELDSSYSPTFAGMTLTDDLDMGTHFIHNSPNPIDLGDVVNLDTLLDHIGVSLRYWLGNQTLDLSVTDAEDYLTETPNAEPDELTNILFQSSVADTPTPFTISEGAIIEIHFDADESGGAGRNIGIYFQLGYVDSDLDPPSFVQIGGDSDTTAALTGAKTSYAVHIHVTSDITIPAGKRLWLKGWSETVSGAGGYPEINVYFDRSIHHMVIPVAGNVLGSFVKRDGTTSLTANWDVGDFTLTAKSFISIGGGETGKFLTGAAGNTIFAYSGDNFDIRAGTGGTSAQNVLRVTSAGDFNFYSGLFTVILPNAPTFTITELDLTGSDLGDLGYAPLLTGTPTTFPSGLGVRDAIVVFGNTIANIDPTIIFATDTLDLLKFLYYDLTADTFVFEDALKIEGTLDCGAINGAYLRRTATGNIALGDATTMDALDVDPEHNIAIGDGAGSGITNGDHNIFIGYRAGYSTTVAGNTIAIGYEALYGGSSRSSTIAIGYQAMRYHYGGNGNTCVGHQAGLGDIGGAGYTYNVFLGEGVGARCNDGSRNTIIGRHAGNHLLDGANNIFIGQQAGHTQVNNSNLLIIDYVERANVGEELTNAILYGVMAATPAGQSLRINANLTTRAISCGEIIATGNIIIPNAGTLGSVGDPDAIVITATGIIALTGQSGFSATMSVNQDIPSGVHTVVEFDTVAGGDDPQNEMNVGTYTWTADEDGKYQVSASLMLNEAIDDTKIFILSIQLNSVDYVTVRNNSSITANFLGIGDSLRIVIAQGDTLRVRVRQNNGDNRQLWKEMCHFSVAKVA